MGRTLCGFKAAILFVGISMGGCMGGAHGGRALRQGAEAGGEVVWERYEVLTMLGHERSPAVLHVPAPGTEDEVQRAPVPLGPVQREALREIRERVETAVAPETWKVKGGTIGEIRAETGGILAVKQTRKNQAQVAEALAGLRETRELQVRVQARVLLLPEERYVAWSGGRAEQADMAVWDIDLLRKRLGEIREDPGAWSVMGPAVIVRDGEPVGLRFGGKGEQGVVGGFRVAVCATLSEDRRYQSIEVAIALGEHPPAAKREFRIMAPDGAGAVCFFLGKLKAKDGEERRAVLLLRSGLLRGE